jgi:hypothetical protein
MAQTMGKRIARNVKGSTCSADNLATTKPVAHKTTKMTGAIAIQLGAGFMGIPCQALRALASVILRTRMHIGYA